MAQISLSVPQTKGGSAVCPPGASTAGRAFTVTNVSRTRGVSMAPVTSPGSASVRPTGAVSSATKVCPSGIDLAGWGVREGVRGLRGGTEVIWFYCSLFIFSGAFHYSS